MMVPGCPAILHLPPQRDGTIPKIVARPSEAAVDEISAILDEADGTVCGRADCPRDFAAMIGIVPTWEARSSPDPWCDPGAIVTEFVLTIPWSCCPPPETISRR
jgi:hypothetical protein